MPVKNESEGFNEFLPKNDTATDDDRPARATANQNTATDDTPKSAAAKQKSSSKSLSSSHAAAKQKSSSNESPRRYGGSSMHDSSRSLGTSSSKDSSSRSLGTSQMNDSSHSSSRRLETSRMNDSSSRSIGTSQMNDSSSRSIGTGRMNDSLRKIRSSRNRRANVRPKRAISAGRGTSRNRSSSSSKSNIGTVTKPVAAEEFEESISSVGVDFGGSFQQDSSRSLGAHRMGDSSRSLGARRMDDSSRSQGTRSAQSRRPNLSPRRAISAGRGTSGNRSLSSSRSNIGTVMKPVTLEEFEQSISSVGMEFDGSFQLDSSKEQHPTFPSSGMNDSSRSPVTRRMDDSSKSLGTGSLHSRRANLSPKPAFSPKRAISTDSYTGNSRPLSSSRSNMGTANSTSNTTGMLSDEDVTMPATLKEFVDESMSSVGEDFGGRLQKDPSMETQSPLKDDDDDFDVDLEMLEGVIKSNANLRFTSSKSSLTIGDLSRKDSNYNRQKEQRRPSILDHFKGMYSSYPGHISTQGISPPRGMAAGHHSSTSYQMSSSSVLGGGHSRRSGRKKNRKKPKRRQSLFDAMQDLFQGGTVSAETDLVDITVDEEKPLEVGLERSGSPGRSTIAPKRKIVLSSILLFGGLVGITIFILVLHLTKDDKPTATVESDSARSANKGKKPNPIPFPLSQDNTTETSTSPRQADIGAANSVLPVATESPVLQSLTVISPGKLDTSKIPASSRAEALAFLIKDQHTSKAEELKLLNSPEAMALEWITQNDTAQLGIPGIDEGHDNEASLRALLQRYALAVLHFSQEAVKTTIDTADISRQARRDIDLKWATGLHECQWPGVFCNSDSMVTAVNLSSSLLQGPLPKELLCGAAFPVMTSLDLSYNHLSGELPFIHHTPSASAIGATPGIIPLQQLRLNNNNLKGWMNTLMLLVELRHLDLRSNQIHGVIPPMISSLTKLTNLNVGNNYLNGNISTVEALINLEFLNLQENDLTSTIPAQLVDLTSLTTLKLGHNEKLSGKISSLPWGQLTKLKSLDLRETHVAGTIPSSLGQMTSLESLYLHGTALSGPMPDDICQLRAPRGALSELESDCDELGTVTCDCCTDCFWG